MALDVQKRLQIHNSGLSNFTSSGIPWILVWVSKQMSKSDAERFERKMKNLNRPRKIKFMRKHQWGLVGEKILDTIEL
jgi:predicted GIY-YIG superfamily endonuclease